MINKKNLFIFLNAFLVLALSLVFVQGAVVSTYTGSIESSPNPDDSNSINFGSPYTYCGDGELNLNKGEQCDRSDLGGATCEYVGYELGSVVCQNIDSPNGQTPGLCILDFSGCYNETTTTDNTNENTGTNNKGGSPSGGSSPTTTNNNEIEECIIYWECEEWGKCDNGTQTRVCVDLNACGTDEMKPSEERDCVNEGISGDEATMEGYKPGFFRSTGLAISDSFTASGNYLGLIILGLIILGIIAFFASKKEDKDKFPEHPKNNKIKKVK